MAWRTVGFSKQWKDNRTFWSLNHDWMAWRTVGFSKQWKDNRTFWSLNHDWMTWRTVGCSKQWKDSGTFWSLNHDWMAWRTVGFSKQWKDNRTFRSWLDGHYTLHNIWTFSDHTPILTQNRLKKRFYFCQAIIPIPVWVDKYGLSWARRFDQKSNRKQEFLSIPDQRHPRRSNLAIR